MHRRTDLSAVALALTLAPATSAIAGEPIDHVALIESAERLTDYAPAPYAAGDLDCWVEATPGTATWAPERDLQGAVLFTSPTDAYGVGGPAAGRAGHRAAGCAGRRPGGRHHRGRRLQLGRPGGPRRPGALPVRAPRPRRTARDVGEATDPDAATDTDTDAAQPTVLTPSADDSGTVIGPVVQTDVPVKAPVETDGYAPLTALAMADLVLAAGATALAARRR